MRYVLGSVLALVALVGASPANAQVGTTMHLIPVVMHAPGVAPSFWKSDVFVHNFGHYPLKVGFVFFPESQANAFPQPGAVPESATRVIGAHQTLLVEDVVLSVFGLDNKKGALLLISDQMYFPSNNGDEDFATFVTSRTYNTGSDPRGTFSQTASNIMFLMNFSSGVSYAAGGRNDSRFRCNMGIGNFFAPKTIKVHYRLRRSDGTPLAEGTKDVPSASIAQWSLSSLGVPATEGPLAFEFWLDPASIGPDFCLNPFAASGFFAFISPVDGARSGEGTGDGEMVFAIPGDLSKMPPCK